MLDCFQRLVCLLLGDNNNTPPGAKPVVGITRISLVHGVWFRLDVVTVSLNRQCEDERFELDMVIEAGNSAIRLLEPMREEIENLESTAGPAQVRARRLLARVALASSLPLLINDGLPGVVS